MVGNYLKIRTSRRNKKKGRLIALFSILVLVSTSVCADEWDDLISAAKEQAPSRSKRKTRSGKRLLMEKAQRMREIDVEVPLLIERKRYETAEAALIEALRLSIESYGMEDMGTADRFAALGIFYARTGRSPEAIGALKRTLNIAEPLIGKDNYRLAAVYQMLAAAYYDLGEYDNAGKNVESLLSGAIDRFGPDSSQAKTAKQLLSKIYSQKGK